MEAFKLSSDLEDDSSPISPVQIQDLEFSSEDKPSDTLNIDETTLFPDKPDDLPLFEYGGYDVTPALESSTSSKSQSKANLKAKIEQLQINLEPKRATRKSSSKVNTGKGFKEGSYTGKEPIGKKAKAKSKFKLKWPSSGTGDSLFQSTSQLLGFGMEKEEKQSRAELSSESELDIPVAGQGDQESKSTKMPETRLESFQEYLFRKQATRRRVCFSEKSPIGGNVNQPQFHLEVFDSAPASGQKSLFLSSKEKAEREMENPAIPEAKKRKYYK